MNDDRWVERGKEGMEGGKREGGRKGEKETVEE